MVPQTRFLPVGYTLTRRGITLVVKERPAAATLEPRDACSGCFFDSLPSCTTRLQCSKYDRRDHTAVWFVREDSSTQL